MLTVKLQDVRKIFVRARFFDPGVVTLTNMLNTRTFVSGLMSKFKHSLFNM